MEFELLENYNYKKTATLNIPCVIIKLRRKFSTISRNKSNNE